MPYLTFWHTKKWRCAKIRCVFPTAYSETWFSLLFSVCIWVLRNIETSRNLYANEPRGQGFI